MLLSCFGVVLVNYLLMGKMTPDGCTRNQETSHTKLASSQGVSWEGQGNERATEGNLTYDQQHRVHPIPTLPDNTSVWVKTKAHEIPSRVVTPADTSHSYVVEVPSGQVRRNRAALTACAESTHRSAANTANNTAGNRTARSQSDIPIRPLIASHTGDGEMWCELLVVNKLVASACPLSLSITYLSVTYGVTIFSLCMLVVIILYRVGD